MEFKRVTLSGHDINYGMQNNSSKKSQIPYLYWVFVIIRILLCLIPQNGYIHPDEFFQSIEIMSGHYFDTDTYKPWEFNNTFPIRTVVFPYLSVGIPYSLINLLLHSCNYYLGINLKTVYYLLLFPRLFMCIISFICDYCLYKICKINNLCHKECLVTFSSSYIMLIYGTRTFSNTIELILLALLLFYVSRCMDFSNKVVYRGNHLKKKYRDAETIVDRVQIYKLMSALPSHSLNDCLIIASIVVAGIFNRPTFMVFAISPIFFWLQRGLGSLVVGFLDFHIRIITFIICTIPSLIFFILVDSFYFGYLTSGEIGRLDISINNFVVTPLNFIKYNTIVDNLKEHGLHPRYLHFLINVPLLFNILGLIGLYLVAQLVYRVIKKQWLQLPRIQSIEGLMITSFAIPITLLSIIPHQEPRFIIPVLFPLSFCCTPLSRQFNSTKTVVQAFKGHNNRSTYFCDTKEKKLQKSNQVKIIWYTCNLTLTLFYGFMHQAGVLPLTTHIATELKAKPDLTHIHLFTSYTYSIPTALLHLRNTKKTYISSDHHKYKLLQDFYLYEKGSEKMENVLNALTEKIYECEYNYKKKKLPYRIYYAMPASAFTEFVELTSKDKIKRFNYTILKTFYPHVTTEMLPKAEFLECVLYYGNTVDCLNMFLSKPINNLFDFLKQFGLLLIKIIPGETSIAL